MSSLCKDWARNHNGDPEIEAALKRGEDPGLALSNKEGIRLADEIGFLVMVKVRKYMRSIMKPGMPMVDLCETLENTVLLLSSGILEALKLQLPGPVLKISCQGNRQGHMDI
ncbi:hypothetical protein SSX86_010841 [Deinandra increscens subsp. villosa]|uniref:Uncharacterized protein n=1 Tax=Deinandra increscens subsp. villosa TaxID=3103831 RepID=A0AAP0H2Q4_9ASTR